MVRTLYYNSNLYPDGYFSMGYCKQQKVSKREKAYDKCCSLQAIVHKYQKSYQYGTDYYSEIVEYHDVQSEFPELHAEAFPHLGSSSEANSHKPKATRSRRGLKGINSYQRAQVRSGAYLLQRRWGRRRLSFCTFTLPSLTSEELCSFVNLGGGWAEFVRKFLQELCRLLRRRGGDGIIVGCSELQEKRWRRRGEVAPHLHLVFCGKGARSSWYVSADEMRRLWKRLLETHLMKCGINIEVDTRASVDCQRVKKDAASYLGKYMSKGGKILEEIVEKHGESVVPTCWVHLSLRMRQYIKRHMRSLDDGEKRAILEGIDLVGRGYCKYLCKIEIPGRNGDTFTVGYVGKKSEDDYVLIPFEYDYWMAWGESVLSLPSSVLGDCLLERK